jgi:hypothetical protein
MYPEKSFRVRTTTRHRTRLGKDEARRRYVEIGERVVLEQIREDARKLDSGSMVIGPFARLGANAVAARDRKTRGSINNAFGSQAAFQQATMALALSAQDWIAAIRYPSPEEFSSAEDWVKAFFEGQSARGPGHGGIPTVDYGSMWALWLSTVPYGMWSEAISRPSLAEQQQWVKGLESVLQQALDHFGLMLRPGTTIGDLALAVAQLVEGAWLNQCLSRQHPLRPERPISDALTCSGLLLWRGATKPRSP